VLKKLGSTIVALASAAAIGMAASGAGAQTAKPAVPPTTTTQPTKVAGAAGRPAAKLAPRSQKLQANRTAPNPAASTEKYAALIVDADTGVTLFSVNADEPRHPASLTKVMTLYLTFEALQSGKLRIDQPLRVSAWASIQSPTKLGLKDGSSITVRDAIFGLITKSANDASVVLAEALAGDEDVFAQRMTEKAHKLGMNATNFRNASGLPNAQQVTTARDLATLALAVMRDFPAYYHLFSTQEFVWGGHVITNHNRMLASYPGADGLKTGYTVASGFNLIMSARRESKRLIGVVMGGETAQARDHHMAELMDRGFSQAGPGIASIGQPMPATIQNAGKGSGEDAIGKRIAQANSIPNANTTMPRVPAGAPTRWAIQVGAFNDQNSARNALNLAMTYLPELTTASAGVAPIDNRGRTLYRARITGVSEQQANNGCRKLEANNIIACQVLRIEAGDADVASN